MLYQVDIYRRAAKKTTRDSCHQLLHYDHGSLIPRGGRLGNPSTVILTTTAAGSAAHRGDKKKLPTSAKPSREFHFRSEQVACIHQTSKDHPLFEFDSGGAYTYCLSHMGSATISVSSSVFSSHPAVVRSPDTLPALWAICISEGHPLCLLYRGELFHSGAAVCGCLF
jgi:hypothetical protein